MKKCLVFSAYAVSAFLFLFSMSCSKDSERLPVSEALGEIKGPIEKGTEEIPLKFANFLDSLYQLRIPENENSRLEMIISSSEFSEMTFAVTEDDALLLSSIWDGQVLNANRIHQTIQNLHSEHPGRTDLIQSLDYLLGMFIFLESLDDEQKMSDFDACFNHCMRKKAEDVANGNWIDQVHFLVGAPVNVAWWTGSCVWDCV